MDIDTDDLIVFLKVVESGSILKASEKIPLPKSTISRRITNLENKLGERLLSRNSRHLSVTEFGQTILEHAQRLQEEKEAILSIAQNRQISPSGILRVSLPPDFDEIDIKSLVLNYTRQYPNVLLELNFSSRRVDLLAEKFDLAVRVAFSLPSEQALVIRKLCPLERGLYASPDYISSSGMPIHPSELQQHSVLGLIGGDTTIQPWSLSNGKETFCFKPQGPFAVNSPTLLKELATQGMGIISLSDRQAQSYISRGLLVQILEQWKLPPTYLWCVMPYRKLRPTRTSAFLELLYSYAS
jgi:DNA-binding transcriptional LysR family regulator